MTFQRSNVFHGTRVIDFTAQLPGALCSMLLADAGAEVITVERPNGSPFRRHEEVFNQTRRNKRSAILDLKTDAGRIAARRLCQTAHIVIDGLRPGHMENFGIGFEQLKSTHGGIVYISLSGFGQDPAIRNRSGHDLTYLAAGGVLDSWVREIGLSVPITPSADLLGAVVGALSALVGLEKTRLTGESEYIDVSLLGAATLAGLLDVGHVGATGQDPSKTMMQDRADYGIYECADGAHIAVAIVDEDHFWVGLTHTLGRPEWAEWTLGERAARNGQIHEWLRSTFMRESADEWAKRLLDNDVPSSKVLKPTEVVRLASERGEWGWLRAATDQSDRPSSVQVFPPYVSVHVPGRPTPSLLMMGEAGASTAEILREVAELEHAPAQGRGDTGTPPVAPQRTDGPALGIDDR